MPLNARRRGQFHVRVLSIVVSDMDRHWVSRRYIKDFVYLKVLQREWVDTSWLVLNEIQSQFIYRCVLFFDSCMRNGNRTYRQSPTNYCNLIFKSGTRIRIKKLTPFIVRRNEKMSKMVCGPCLLFFHSGSHGHLGTHSFVTHFLSKFHEWARHPTTLRPVPFVVTMYTGLRRFVRRILTNPGP